MIRAAIEKIEEMVQPQQVSLNGHDYLLDKDGTYKEILPEYPSPDEINLYSLDALVKMVRTEATRQGSTVYITIPSHQQALCFSGLIPSERMARDHYYRACAQDVPGWESSVQMGFEEAMIALRTRFQESDDTEYVLQLLNNISTGSKVTFNDNGVATTVVTQHGVSLVQSDNIRPIVNLKPYRTFQEVDQPESPFLIRISERAIRFIEADGGMWKLQARQTIKAFLETQLAAEIEAGAVIVAL